MDLLPRVGTNEVPRRAPEFHNAVVSLKSVGLDAVWPERPNEFADLVKSQFHDIFDA